MLVHISLQRNWRWFMCLTNDWEWFIFLSWYVKFTCRFWVIVALTAFYWEVGGKKQSREKLNQFGTWFVWRTLGIVTFSKWSAEVVRKFTWTRTIGFLLTIFVVPWSGGLSLVLWVPGSVVFFSWTISVKNGMAVKTNLG